MLYVIECWIKGGGGTYIDTLDNKYFTNNKYLPWPNQGSLAEGEGSVQLVSLY